MNPSRRTRFLAAASLLIALVGCNSRSGHSLALANQPEQTAPTVLEDQIRSDVYYLASDRLEGRGVGTQGLDLAADYIATRFASLGLKPLPGLGSYFQSFDITTAESIDPATTLASGDAAWQLKETFTALSFSGEGRFSAPLVFVGYGVTDPTNHYDDYANMDVKGKVVLAMRFEPHDDKGKSRWAKGAAKEDYTPNAHLETKVRVAAEHGAVALLLVNPPTYHDHGDDPLLPFSRQYVGGVALPVLQVKRSVADDLLKRGGAPTLAVLQQQIDQRVQPASSDVNNVSVTGNVAIKRTKKTVRNVIAYLPGTGAHADEYVMVGAHYDHLGWGGPGSLMNMPTSHAALQVPGQIKDLLTPGGDASNPHATTLPTTSAIAAIKSTTAPTTRAIHHGADDNASGTATVLELARLFAHSAADHPPQRSIIFATFTAEESGLIGSARFANHPPIDLKKIVAMLNLDMVGRIRKNLLYVGGGGTAAPFHDLLKKADADSPLEFKNFGDGGMGPSDHMSFAVKKIPVLFLFSGIHEDYHRPTDTADKINYDGIAKVARMSVELIDDLACMPKSQYVDAADKVSMMSPMSAGTGGEVEGGRRASLGVIPEYGEEEDGKGVKIGGTSAGTPAAQAGLQAGDVVLKLGDQATGTLMELSTALNSHKPGDKVKLIYRRGAKEVTTEITLAARGG
ncbi:MAG: peptidase [Phycisphaerales bacterium]|nr:peptidase [Phycisphaerales bacterium]